MAIARVTVLDFADEESKKHNLNLYESRWKEVFPNMHMNMIISTGPTSFLSISCLLYTSPSPRDRTRSRMPSSA